MAEKPNFLIIMSDQHAPGTIGAAGHSAVQTPTLDGLMERGISFDNAYCPYPICTPSRASFMTGQLAPAHGVWELGSPLRSDIPTWAHVLRRAGYITSISGRMHFVGADDLHGFERRVYPEFHRRLSPYAYADWTRPVTDDGVMIGAVQAAGPTKEWTACQQFDEAVTDAAQKELAFLNGSQNAEPWALMVGYTMPHFPFHVSQKYYDLYNDVPIPAPRPAPDGKNYAECTPPIMRGFTKWLGLSTDRLSGDEIEIARRCYYGMISHVDELIGKLVEQLRVLSCLENTWIVYVSDHGESLGEHGLWSKMTFYEESVGVPFIVVPPQCINAGAHCQAPVSLIDWMSTLLEITGEQERFETLPGRSLIPLLDNPAEEWPDRAVISDYACCGTQVPLRMVRRGKWKAVFAPGLPALLFDLKNDPHEWDDLGGNASSQAVLDELRAEAERDGWDGETVRDEVFRQQRRLSYIHLAETKC
jgi:choline-sulfatase